MREKSLVSFDSIGTDNDLLLNSSNADGSFTMADSNSFLNPQEILPKAQENKYLGIFQLFFLFYHENAC